MAGFDDIKDKSLLSGKAQELLKGRQERMNTKSVQEVRVLEKIAQDMAEIDKISAALTKNFERDQVQELSRLSARVEEMKKLAQRVESGRSFGADKSFKQAVGTLTSSSSNLADISAASRASNNLGMSLNMAQGSSTSSLEETISRGKALIGRQSERIRDTVAGGIEGHEGQFTSQMALRERLINNVGQAQAAMSAQKKLGVDSQSSYYNAADVAQRVRQDQERGAISSGVAQGAFGNRKQVEEQMDSVGKRLIATFEALDSAIKTNSKDTGDLSKEFNTLEKEYKRHKEVVGEMNRSGGGGGQSGISVAGGIIGNLGTIGQGIAQGYRHASVTSEMSQAQNRIGMANLAASRYNDITGASHGDMSSLRRVMSDQYGEQVRRGLLLGGREDNAKLGETVSLGAKAVGTGIDSATGPSGIWAGVKGLFTGGPAGAAGGAITQGLAAATPDALGAATSGIDYAKQITQHQTLLQSAAQQRQLQDAVSQISDASSQFAFDQQKGLTYATRGLGIGSKGIGSEYYKNRSFTGTGALGEQSAGILNTDEPTAIHASGNIPKMSSNEMDMARRMIMGKEGLSLNGYQDTQRGHSIGYGHFVAGNSQKGMHVSKEEADAMFNDDMNSHSAAANRMVGKSGMARLNPSQKAALYDLAFNAGPGALKYGGKDSIASRLQRGDVTGAGQRILNTATTAGGHHSAAVEARRRQEYEKYSGGTGSGSSDSPGGYSTSNIVGGGDRQNVQSLLSDPKIIAQIAQQAGLSGGDVSKLTSMGVSGLGKEFARGNGSGAVQDITRAGQLSRIGYMQSPEQYMQARSQMSGSGGTSENFEQILKNAVANGMDSSKNIMEMVQATSSIAQRSSGAGIGAFGGAAEGLGKGIDALRATGVSENMAVQGAQNAANAAEDMSGDKGLDIANVIETARIRKNFGKADLSQMEAMRTASPAETRNLRNLYKSGKTSEANEQAIKMGVFGENGVHDEASAGQLFESTSEQVIHRATGFGVNRKMEESIQEARKSGRSLSAAERTFLNSRTRGNVGRNVSGDALMGYVSAGGANQGALARDPGGVVSSGEDTIKVGATHESREYTVGIENMTKAMGGLEALGATMMKVSESIKPDEFSKSVKDAADKLQVPMTTFSKSVTDFNTAVNNLLSVFKTADKSKYGLLENINPFQDRKK